jgi:hypothetical protein
MVTEKEEKSVECESVRRRIEVYKNRETHLRLSSYSMSEYLLFLSQQKVKKRKENGQMANLNGK